jgi:hypothetical protein
MTTQNATDKPMSKADQAIEYMAKHQVTVYAAAKAVDVNPSAVYRRIGQLRAYAGKRCPCCGQIVQKST